MAAEPLTSWCVGGPLDGQQVTVRSDPFLAADKAASKAWVYRSQGDGTFAVSSEHDNSLNYPDGPSTGERTLDEFRLWTAGHQAALDIIAVGGDD